MMNKDQLYYRIAELSNSHKDKLYLTFGGFFVGWTAMQFSNENFIPGIISYLTTNIYAYWGLKAFSTKQRLNSGIKNIHPSDHLEDVDEIVISDEEELEKLLKRTALKEKLEWGTFLEAHTKGKTAIVDNILDSYEAERKGYIAERRKAKLFFYTQRAINDGYNGFHHFHPKAAGIPDAVNFKVHNYDQISMPGFLDLLTFNFCGKPEVIGFNRRFTYIPEERDCKSRLVRASSKDIMRYLER